MALDEKILEDSNWETQNIQAILTGDVIQVDVKRKHKYEGATLICNISLDMSQAKGLAKQLISLVHDHESQT